MYEAGLLRRGSESAADLCWVEGLLAANLRFSQSRPPMVESASIFSGVGTWSSKIDVPL
jgi:hypothetical protein